jgi:hypothetical protein
MPAEANGQQRRVAGPAMGRHRAHAPARRELTVNVEPVSGRPVSAGARSKTRRGGNGGHRSRSLSPEKHDGLLFSLSLANNS